MRRHQHTCTCVAYASLESITPSHLLPRTAPPACPCPGARAAARPAAGRLAGGLAQANPRSRSTNTTLGTQWALVSPVLAGSFGGGGMNPCRRARLAGRLAPCTHLHTPHPGGVQMQQLQSTRCFGQGDGPLVCSYAYGPWFYVIKCVRLDHAISAGPGTVAPSVEQGCASRQAVLLRKPAVLLLRMGWLGDASAGQRGQGRAERPGMAQACAWRLEVLALRLLALLYFGGDGTHVHPPRCSAQRTRHGADPSLGWQASEQRAGRKWPPDDDSWSCLLPHMHTWPAHGRRRGSFHPNPTSCLPQRAANATSQHVVALCNAFRKPVHSATTSACCATAVPQCCTASRVRHGQPQCSMHAPPYCPSRCPCPCCCFRAGSAG